jgi:hypothetical protein
MLIKDNYEINIPLIDDLLYKISSDKFIKLDYELDLLNSIIINELNKNEQWKINSDSPIECSSGVDPFDTSSEYTFMGTLMRNLMTASVSANNVIGNLGRITSVVNKSLLALTPASHAGDAIDEIVTVGDYPEINSLVDDGQKRIATAFGEP